MEIADYANSKNLSAILATFGGENKISKAAQSQPISEQIETQFAVKTEIKTQANKTETPEHKTRADSPSARENRTENLTLEQGR